ncbi:MAG: type II secretion system F family protein [Acidobacteria bacterium]|nr:type II secretion system F family protein [Acidobacteriota bacterium]
MKEVTLLFTLLATITGIGFLVNNPVTALRSRLKTRKALNLEKTYRTKVSSLNTLMEIPDFCNVLWFLVSAGHNLEHALRITVSRTSGCLSAEFRQVIEKVDYGSVLQQELDLLASTAKSEPIRELATKLSVSIVNGSGLADQLAEFITSSSAKLRSKLLDKAAKSETKMMIPLVFIILPITVVFALYPSVVIIQESFN